MFVAGRACARHPDLRLLNILDLSISLVILMCGRLSCGAQGGFPLPDNFCNLCQARTTYRCFIGKLPKNLANSG